MLLFITTGIGNGSTFRMIPVIFRTMHERLHSPDAITQARKESAAVVGFRRDLRHMVVLSQNVRFRSGGKWHLPCTNCILYYMYRFDMVVLFTQKCPISLLVLNKNGLLIKAVFIISSF